ncbi:hypothetical protein HEP84_18955 [Streptomyces sp. RLB1-33]|nr:MULTISPECIES: hypothetical protein [Streptomyces]QIY70961.1 hypothetical protein HEP84_18955 [Streptomyces sp. RLB1-33]QUW82119.1 hypothetical protein SMIR_25985 [Streptomyces mirabilis]
MADSPGGRPPTPDEQAWGFPASPPVVAPAWRDGARQARSARILNG